MTRIALPLSIALIATHWMWHLLHVNWELPASVGAIAVAAGFNAGIVLGLTWLLLHASGERLADLGFSVRAVRCHRWRRVRRGTPARVRADALRAGIRSRRPHPRHRRGHDGVCSWPFVPGCCRSTVCRSPWLSVCRCILE